MKNSIIGIIWLIMATISLVLYLIYGETELIIAMLCCLILSNINNKSWKIVGCFFMKILPT